MSRHGRGRGRRDTPATEGTFDMGQFASAFQAYQDATRGNPAAERPQGREKYLKEFLHLNPPKFEGSPDASVNERWIERVIKDLDILDIPMEYRVRFATYLFEGTAEHWWRIYLVERPGLVMQWPEFEKAFFMQFVPEEYRLERLAEFFRLVQGNMSVVEYYMKFTELSRYNRGTVASPEVRAVKFRMGLRPSIRRVLAPMQFSEISDIMRAARRAEMEQNGDKGKSKELVARGRRAGESGSGPIQKSRSSGTRGRIRFSGSGRCAPYGTCHRCGQFGHYRRNCPQLQRQQDYRRTGFQSQSQGFGYQQGSSHRVVEEEGNFQPAGSSG